MKKTIVTAVSAGLLAMGMAMPAALADDTVCRGTIGAKSVENVEVPQGATCYLKGTDVQGNVEIKNGAKLYATDVDVDGNVQSEGYKVVQVKQGSFVGGSVQLKNGLRGGNATVSSSTIDSDLQFEENRAKVSAIGSSIRGNVQAVQNTGGVVFKNNRISENFQCKQNNPAPTGGGNKAGDKEGQCSRL